MPDATPARRRRFRFSILNLALLTTIVALSVTVALLYREVNPLRQEVARLRGEVGELHLGDPAMLHAICVETDNELEWKWRIWIPNGASCRLRGYAGMVPRQGYPDEGHRMFLRQSGEHVIRYRIRRDPRDGGWYGRLHTQGGSVGKDHQPWVEWSSRTTTSGGVGSSTRAYQTDARVELIRFRASNREDSWPKIEDPAVGFMIWLEPN
jgi:hypothetical protein